ncbi:MAG: hypothetical protein U9O53_02515 [archaeon]|nr:hypothetical protein [archaeon]
MHNVEPQAESPINEDERKKDNRDLIRFLQNTMKDGRSEVDGLRKKLGYTYWILVILSIVMFVLGIALLSVPVFAAYQDDIDRSESVIAAGFGIADLAALFLFRPVERIHRLMGDMSQITLSINSFQSQEALILLEMDISKRETMGEAAERIKEAAKNSIGLIQTYFEETKLS